LSCIIPENTHYKTANIEQAEYLIEIHVSLPLYELHREGLVTDLLIQPLFRLFYIEAKG